MLFLKGLTNDDFESIFSVFDPDIKEAKNESAASQRRQNELDDFALIGIVSEQDKSNNSRGNNQGQVHHTKRHIGNSLELIGSFFVNNFWRLAILGLIIGLVLAHDECILKTKKAAHNADGNQQKHGRTEPTCGT